MANRTKRTPEKGEKFLTFLRRSGGNVSRACKAENISRNTAYLWRAEDENFARLWEEAVEAGTDDLEQEARRRALDGLRRKKFTKNGDPIIDPATGKQYEELEYSDTLLIFLMKGNRPDKYRDRVEMSFDVSKLTDEELQAITKG